MPAAFSPFDGDPAPSRKAMRKDGGGPSRVKRPRPAGGAEMLCVAAASASNKSSAGDPLALSVVVLAVSAAAMGSRTVGPAAGRPIPGQVVAAGPRSACGPPRAPRCSGAASLAHLFWGSFV